MPEDQEIVAFLARTFPSLAALEPAEGLRRAESLGLFTASAFAAGAAGMASRGVQVPPEVFDQLAPVAGRVAQARRGGATFLAHLRAALQDARFVPVITTLATLFARSTRPAGMSSGSHQALPPQPAEAPPAPAPEPAAQPAATPTGGATSLALSSAGGRVVVREIAGYELMKQLGEGGMGKVFKARQKSVDRIVALKVLSTALAKDAEYVERFHREALAGAKLHHPNIVAVIDHGIAKENGVHYIAFEFVDGMTASDIAKARGGKMPEREALALGRAVADALRAAEHAGIVHRDIKPDNVMVSREGVPKLVDLGLAKKQDERQTMTVVGVVMGTPHYMAPEQGLGEKEIDNRADIYALGMMLFKLVTGQFAYDADSSTAIIMRHVTESCPDPRTVDRSVSEGFARIILKCCAREKEARYQAAHEIIKDIDLVLAGKPPIVAQPGTASGAVPAAGRGARATQNLGRSASGIQTALSASSAGIAVPDEPFWLTEVEPAAIPDAGPPLPSGDSSREEQCLADFLRTGKAECGAEAAKAVEARLSKKSGAEAAAVEAELARIQLVRGDKAQAELRAKAALDKDPRCKPAFEVQARAARGDADRNRIETGLAQVREALRERKLDDAKKAVDKVRDIFILEPHGMLGAAVVAKLGGDEGRFLDSLKKAWGAFPSKERSDALLGGLDGIAADLLVAYGRTAWRGDGTLMRSTVENLDDKSNLIAGSLRMAIAIARVALERGRLGLFEQRRLHFAMARALGALRRCDLALDAIGKAEQLGPSDGERRVYDAEKAFVLQVQQLEQAQPKAQGRFRCVGAIALHELAKTRLAFATRERTNRQGELEKIAALVSTVAQKDSTAKKEIRQAADQLGKNDPFEELEPIERELEEIARDRARGSKSSDSSGEKTGGFFGKLVEVASSAAAGVASAAREAQLKLKESQARSRHDAALKKFAAILGADLRDFDWKHAKVVPLMQKAAIHGVAVSFWTDEEERVKKELERHAPFA